MDEISKEVYINCLVYELQTKMLRKLIFEVHLLDIVTSQTFAGLSILTFEIEIRLRLAIIQILHRNTPS